MSAPSRPSTDPSGTAEALEGFPNPVVPSLLARDIAPFLPAYLLGVALAAEADARGAFGTATDVLTFDRFVLLYTALVAVLVGGFFVRHLRSAPVRLVLDSTGITGWVHRGVGVRPMRIPFACVLDVPRGGFLGARVEARDLPGLEPTDRPIAWDWLRLTDENAERVASAWATWRGADPAGRAAGSPPSTP